MRVLLQLHYSFAIFDGTQSIKLLTFNANWMNRRDGVWYWTTENDGIYFSCDNSTKPWAKEYDWEISNGI